MRSRGGFIFFKLTLREKKRREERRRKDSPRRKRRMTICDRCVIIKIADIMMREPVQ
jgi:hypothetical protein